MKVTTTYKGFVFSYYTEEGLTYKKAIIDNHLLHPDHPVHKADFDFYITKDRYVYVTKEAMVNTNNDVEFHKGVEYLKYDIDKEASALEELREELKEIQAKNLKTLDINRTIHIIWGIIIALYFLYKMIF